MTDNVHFWAVLLLLTYRLSYIAGKHDFWGRVVDWLDRKAEAREREKHRSDAEKGCETCRWNDTDPNEVGCPCWNCKGDCSEYEVAMRID